MTTEAAARIKLAKAGFRIGITPTKHYFFVAPDGAMSLQDHGCLESPLGEARTWGHPDPPRGQICEG